MPGSRAERAHGARGRPWTNAALVAPLLLLLLAAFVMPVVALLLRGMTEREVPVLLPRTAALLRQDPAGWRTDTGARTLAAELVTAQRNGTISLIANRLNYDTVGSRSLILATAQRATDGLRVRRLADLRAIDARWGEPAIWASIRHAARSPTDFYLLSALDRRRAADGRVTSVAEARRVFVAVYLRTFKISALVALFCIVLGYPLAYLIAHQPPRRANVLLLLVLLPFWTSTLVRTTAWVVLLQTNGVVNNALRALGVVEAPIALVYNRAGVYIAMTHVLLPFFILPLYGVMRRIPPTALRAAQSLGASPLLAFRRVYLPQTLPGVAAGTAIVFVLALGYYITPALVGGGGDQMIGGSIAYYVDQSLNWGMAAALSLLLLVPLALVAIAARIGLGARR